MKKLISSLLFFILFTVHGSQFTVHAQIGNPALTKPSLQTSNPIGYTSSVIQALFSIFFVIGVVYFCWFIFMAAFHMIDSWGDSKKIEDSKREFTYGILGLTVLFSIFAFLKLIGYVFGLKGLELLQLDLPIL